MNWTTMPEAGVMERSLMLLSQRTDTNYATTPAARKSVGSASRCLS